MAGGYSDKLDREHFTPLTAQAIAVLKEARRHRPAIAEGWVFPSDSDPAKPCDEFLVHRWWLWAEEAAELTHVPTLGWHGLRRKFGEELKGVPLKDLCALGGWLDPGTVVRCYQRPDDVTMRRALEARRVVNRE